MHKSATFLLALLLAAASAIGAQQAQQPAPASAPAQPDQPPANAVISPDSRRAVWPSDDQRSVWSAWRKTATAPWETPTRLLTIRGTVRNLLFSPDGSKILFENPRALTGRGGGETWAFIVVFDIAKRTIAYVDPQFSIDSAPAWSAGGREISFTRKFGSLPATSLTKPVPEVRAWTPPPAKPDDVFSLASSLAIPFVYAPVASGDGKSIAYVAREGVARNIYFWRVDTRGLKTRGPVQIATFGGDDGHELNTPAVSKTGGAVAFVRGDTSNPTQLPDPPQAEIWIVSTDGGQPQRIGPGLAPRFSDDDQRLIWGQGNNQFSSTLTWKAGRFVSASKPERVPATTVAAELRGAMSPDGKKVANRSAAGISIYDIASKQSWDVPDSAGGEATLSWSHDSRYLGFRKNATGTSGSAGINGYRFNGVPVASDPFSVWVVDRASTTTKQH